MKKPLDLNADYQPESFKFRDQAEVKDIFSRYPEGFQRSAIMPLLDLAQRQLAEDGAKANPPFGGWITRAAMDHIAELVGQPPIKVYEVATFYSMYNLAPVGKHLVQVCGTTPCWLRGSDKIMQACEKHMGIHAGEHTANGQFSLMEVECLGACVNAPMVQINDHFYEDLTAENMKDVLVALEQGKNVTIGSQTGRKCSMAEGGTTTLTKLAKKTGVA